jgi:hypothetical protein
MLSVLSAFFVVLFFLPRNASNCFFRNKKHTFTHALSLPRSV